MFLSVLLISGGFANDKSIFEAQVFETNNQSLLIRELSQQEMKDTKGAILPIWVIATGSGIVGGALGGLRYAYGATNISLDFCSIRGICEIRSDARYDWDTGDFIGNIATGMIIGAGTGAASVVAGGGLSLGANLWRIDGAMLNFGTDMIWQR